MNPKLKSALKYLLFIGIGGFLFYMAFKNTELDKLIEDFKKAKYEYVLLSMLMGFLAFVSRGIRWTYLLEPIGYKVNTWRSIHSISMGYFMNALIPRAGELARCTTLNQTDKVPVDRLFGTVILERIIDFIMLALLIMLTFILEYDTIMSFFDSTMNNESAKDGGISWKMIAAIGVLLTGIVLYFMRSKLRHLSFYGKVKDFWNGLKEGVKSISKLEHKWFFLGHTLFIWAMYFFMSYIVVFALEATSHVDISSGLFVMIVGAFGILAPSPGGIGSFHYLAMLGMSFVGVAKDDGLSFATLVHTGQTVMTLIAGGVALIALYRFRKRRKRKRTKY